MPLVIDGLQRLVSSPKVFREPTQIEDSVAFIDALPAAATNHLGEHLVSFDRDFGKPTGGSQFTLLEAKAA